jgi:hypothetical protein
MCKFAKLVTRNRQIEAEPTALGREPMNAVQRFPSPPLGVFFFLYTRPLGLTAQKSSLDLLPQREGKIQPPLCENQQKIPSVMAIPEGFVAQLANCSSGLTA